MEPISPSRLSPTWTCPRRGNAMSWPRGRCRYQVRWWDCPLTVTDISASLGACKYWVSMIWLLERFWPEAFGKIRRIAPPRCGGRYSLFYAHREISPRWGLHAWSQRQQDPWLCCRGTGLQWSSHPEHKPAQADSSPWRTCSDDHWRYSGSSPRGGWRL